MRGKSIKRGAVKARAAVAAAKAPPPSASFSSKYVALAMEYATAVVSGKEPACLYVRQACQRHLDDLKRAEQDTYPYRFDALAAHKPSKFIENLPHTKGEWAKRAECIKLQGWQAFNVVCLFGWLRKDSGLRRFTEYYAEIPRKNAKSTLASAIGLYMLTADGEFGPEVYSGASTEKQAWEVFRPAKLMVERTVQLAAAFSMETYAKSIVTLKDNGRFEPLIGKPGDGASPSCAIVDEFHEHDTPDLIDTMQTGMGARRQPLTFIITTAGYNLAGPCYDKRIQVIHMLEGSVPNEQLFGIIYTIDAEDDWTDPKVLRKANPNYGVSVMEEFLLQQQRTAVLNVSQQNRFKTKYLNVWCAAKAAWMNLQQWQLAGDKDLTPDELKGEDCWFTLDLASKSDLCAYIKLFKKRIKDLDHFYCFARYYLPEDSMQDAGINGPAYTRWVKAGILTLTPGATVDYDTIRDDVLADAALYRPKEVVYDPFNALYMAQQVMDEGLEAVEFTQTPQNFAVPMDEVVTAVKDNRFHHNGCQMTTWMVSNTAIRPAKKGLFAPTKERPEQKIDGVVALLMGMSRATAILDDKGLGGWLKNANKVPA